MMKIIIIIILTILEHFWEFNYVNTWMKNSFQNNLNDKNNNKNVMNECLHLARVPQFPSVKQGLDSPSCRCWAAHVSSVQDQREIWALQLSVLLWFDPCTQAGSPSTHPGARVAVWESHSASAPLKPHLSEGFIPPCKTLKKQTGKHNDCQLFCGSVVCHVARKPQHCPDFLPPAQLDGLQFPQAVWSLCSRAMRTDPWLQRQK